MVAEISNTDIDLEYQKEAVMVVIVWQLDLQLPVQSVKSAGMYFYRELAKPLHGI
jgi:hypothetical protein